MKPDGIVSYKMHCPVPICSRKFTVTYKSYKSYYKGKNESRTNVGFTPAKWHFSSIKMHLLSEHSNDYESDEYDEHSDNTGSAQTSNNEHGQRQNQDDSESHYSKGITFRP